MRAKPFADACERNREPILRCLLHHFRQASRVLEVGSGTGQHAVSFAAAMPWLEWQPSELRQGLEGIRAWADEAQLGNLHEPLLLDVHADDWPQGAFDAAFSANTLHIIDWQGVVKMFGGLSRLLGRHAVLAVYGPFNYGGKYTSESNAAFDRWLAQRDPLSAIRDTAAVNALARAGGFIAIADHALPANNRLLVWRKS